MRCTRSRTFACFFLLADLSFRLGDRCRYPTELEGARRHQRHSRSLEIISQLMENNPYRTPNGTPNPAPQRKSRVGCAIPLFLAASPLLLIGSVWLTGGSRPHYSHIVIPLGACVLAAAATMIGVGIWFCFGSRKQIAILWTSATSDMLDFDRLSRYDIEGDSLGSMDNKALNRSVLSFRAGQSSDGRASHCIRLRFH